MQKRQGTKGGRGIENEKGKDSKKWHEEKEASKEGTESLLCLFSLPSFSFFPLSLSLLQFNRKEYNQERVP